MKTLDDRNQVFTERDVIARLIVVTKVRRRISTPSTDAYALLNNIFA